MMAGFFGSKFKLSSKRRSQMARPRETNCVHLNAANLHPYSSSIQPAPGGSWRLDECFPDHSNQGSSSQKLLPCQFVISFYPRCTIWTMLGFQSSWLLFAYRGSPIPTRDGNSPSKMVAKPCEREFSCMRLCSNSRYNILIITDSAKKAVLWQGIQIWQW